MVSRAPRMIGTLGLIAACGRAPAPATTTTEKRPQKDPMHAHGHGHHHRFDDAAAWAKVFDDPARDAWQKPDRVVALLRIDPGMTVADIGAGTGYFEPILARAVGPRGSVIAIDVEPNMVTWLNDRATREGWKNVNAKLGAPDDPKLADASVQRVLIVDTWHHIDDRVAFAKKIERALSAGGALFIVDYTKSSPHGPPAPARLLPEDVAREMTDAGLGTVKIHLPETTGLPYQYVVEGAKR